LEPKVLIEHIPLVIHSDIILDHQISLFPHDSLENFRQPYFLLGRYICLFPQSVPLWLQELNAYGSAQWEQMLVAKTVGCLSLLLVCIAQLSGLVL
jgi:hypothetical protein